MLGEGDPDSLKAAEGKIGEIMKAEEEAVKKAADELSYSIDDMMASQEKNTTEKVEENNEVPADNNKNTEKPTCRYYIMRNCKHGRLGKGCNFAHPKICISYARNGDRKGECKKGSECTYYHPKICFQSLEKRECSRKTCKFFHVNQTKSTYEEMCESSYDEPVNKGSKATPASKTRDSSQKQ